ncbi:MAG: hypothetical protein DRN35_03365 [Thermoplasmata archaeon]|nr:MAG: hypothetical protein DRN35_03365 [Thermoplasmata archaeon]RLF73460.1 MAG: hypothetical protein DRN55_03420 [Thermoplasmata archaeon]HDD60477.1 ABC transporter ATP-binding protein [Euryarchaeota archaeon]
MSRKVFSYPLRLSILMLFELKGIWKSFGSKTVLEDLSLSVDSGEVVGLLGPNGAGKTTALRIAVHLLRPERGEVLFRGKNTREAPAEYLAKVGYVPEDPLFYEHLTGWELIELVNSLRGHGPRGGSQRLLKAFDLLDSLSSPVGELSKGQRRGLSIAIAMLHRPDLLLLDEPTSGLDPGHVHTFKRLLKNAVKNGAGALLSTHITALAEEVCQRIAIIKEGRIVEGPADVEDLLERNDSQNVEELFLRVVGKV